MKGQTNLLIEKKWFKCIIRPEAIDLSDPVSQLDTQLMTKHVFGTILGIENI
jgi:uncharacterized protein (DUF1015 family)